MSDNNHRALIEQARANLLHRGALEGMLEGEIQAEIARLADALEHATPICGAIPDEHGAKPAKEFPVQGGTAIRSLPWDFAAEAWAAYEGFFGRSQSMERMAQRGGFDLAELDCLFNGCNPCDWRRHSAEEKIRLRQSWTGRLATIRAEDRDIAALRDRLAAAERERDRALEQRDAAQARAEKAEKAVARWEEFDFERDNPARLVEKVLELMVERDKLKGDQSHVKAEWAAFLERAASAEARAERLAGYVHHRQDCARVGYRHAECSCGLSAALGLAAGGKSDE